MAELEDVSSQLEQKRRELAEASSAWQKLTGAGPGGRKRLAPGDGRPRGPERGVKRRAVEMRDPPRSSDRRSDRRRQEADEEESGEESGEEGGPRVASAVTLPGAERRRGGIESRLSRPRPADADHKKEAAPPPERPRRASAARPEDKGRSKRLFGMLLGTLKQAKEQSATRTKAELKLQEIDAKVV